MSTAIVDPTSLGGGIQGISVKQTTTDYRDTGDAMTRGILRRAWNTGYAAGPVNGYQRAIGEFKAVNNIGDYLNRQNYVCNVPTPVQPNHVAWRSRIGSIIQNCDQTGIPCSNTNTRFVPDSSDYITYKRQRAANQLYNDAKFGGDQSNASYTFVLGANRGLNA